jgi:Arc/MetJ family transcription regulator
MHVMRTNIVIDEALMAEAMKAGPYKTKKEAVEAGLRLLARQAAYREILKWRGKLKWEGDDDVDWTQPPEPAPLTTGEPGLARPLMAREPEPKAYKRRARR